MLIILILTVPFFIVAKPAEANEGIDVNYKVVLLSPASNTSYIGSMPLNYTVEWTKGNWTSWIIPRYNFSIDNGPMVSIYSPYIQGGQFIDFEDTNPVITVTNEVIDISNLTDGMHSLTLFADGTIDEADLVVTSFNLTLAKTYFQVGNFPTPTPSPNITPSSYTHSLLTLPTLAILAFIVLIIVSLLVYFKKRRGTNRNMNLKKT